MSARERILSRIRGRLGSGGGGRAAPRAALSARLAAHEPGPRPREDGDAVSRFLARAAGLQSTVDMVATQGAVPAAVAAYLGRCGLPREAVCWPALACLDWQHHDIEIAVRDARDTDRVGITAAFCAIAETGTLMTLSGADTPSTVSLLPDTHVAIVAAPRVVRGMEEAWQLLRAEHGEPPRAVHFISGPSRSADIEQTVALGAHGPARVHIVLVRDGA